MNDKFYFDDCWHGVLQYMVVYELLLSVAVNILLFIDGSRFSVVQVGPPAPAPTVPLCLCCPPAALPLGMLVSRPIPCTCPYGACAT